LPLALRLFSLVYYWFFLTGSGLVAAPGKGKYCPEKQRRFSNLKNMRTYIALILLILCYSAAFSQDITFERQVIGSAGAVAGTADLEFSYTVGETVIFTGEGLPDRVFTQGFQQPEQGGFVTTIEPAFSTRYKVYPNPASASVSIELTTEKATDLSIRLYTSDGKPLLQQRQSVNGFTKTTLDVSRLPAATYYLVLYDPALDAYAVEPLPVVR
jgi:hypothetical protein